MRVFFTVATHYYAQKESNVGYSWGILYHELEAGKYKVYIASPEERGRIIALQNIPASLFDEAGILDKFCILDKSNRLFKKLYFLDPENEHSYSIEIPESFNIEFHLELVSKYLRRTVSGYDDEQNVYTLPSIEEMENIVAKVKKVVV